MIRTSDRIIVVFHGFSIDANQFGIRYKDATGKAVNSIDTWLGGTEPRIGAVVGIIDVIAEFVPEPSREIVKAIMIDKDLEPWKLLLTCNVRYDEVKLQVSEDFRRLVKRGGMMVESIAQLTEYGLRKQGPIIKLFQQLTGRWTLYRAHSLQTGILRETIVFDKATSPVGRGTYYQYDARASAATKSIVFRTLQIDIFFCGDVVTAIGVNPYDDGRKLDPVLMTVVTEPVVTKVAPYANFVHLPGTILALADGGHMPAAMRLVVRQDTTTALLEEGMEPVSLVHDPDESDLYGPATDNSVANEGSPLLHSHEWLSGRLLKGTRAIESRRRPPRQEDDDGA